MQDKTHNISSDSSWNEYFFFWLGWDIMAAGTYPLWQFWGHESQIFAKKRGVGIAFSTCNLNYLKIDLGVKDLDSGHFMPVRSFHARCVRKNLGWAGDIQWQLVSAGKKFSCNAGVPKGKKYQLGPRERRSEGSRRRRNTIHGMLSGGSSIIYALSWKCYFGATTPFPEPIKWRAHAPVPVPQTLQYSITP